jgi:hypothetical protein
LQCGVGFRQSANLDEEQHLEHAVMADEAHSISRRIEATALVQEG